MHMGDTALWDGEGEELGLCKSSGYYATARDKFNDDNVLSAEDRIAFFDEGNTQYKAARERLAAWAVANGEAFSSTDKVLKASGSALSQLKSMDSVKTNTALIVTIVAGVGALVAGSLFLFRKKKEN